MTIIKKLSQEEAQKIAAGEVVERPSSVVKELMENSIDAGATTITISIKEGGRKLISCADNGHGMEPLDARACIETHATSKITKVEDLAAIQTFGFRGEALGSLAAIATLYISTKNAEHTEGIRLTVKNSAIVQEEIIAHQVGTTIEVHNLFNTVPARLKFLKKDETEQRHITQLFDALCLAHPQVHAKLVINDTTQSHYPTTKTIGERAHQILMHKTDTPLLPVLHHKNGILIEGAISNHQVHRFDKSNMYLFVNRRWVKNISLSRAVMRAYTVLPAGKFPVVSLHITIDPAIIDVNIHPRKEEIAFANSSLVETAITTALKDALESTIASHIRQQPPASYIMPQYTTWSPIINVPLTITAPHIFKAGPQLLNSTQETFPSTALEHVTPHDAAHFTHNTVVQETVETDHATVLGQLDATYILATAEKGLTIIDQHAAHERILYEQFASRFGSIEMVQLLFPEIIHLSNSDCSLLTEYQELLTQHGIQAEQFGAQQIRITALPIFAKHISAQEIITTFIATLHETPTKTDVHTIVTHTLRAQMACKAAVKAGDTLTIPHMQQLLRDLVKTANNVTCPHGRPTYWVITITELEKKFQRTM